MNARADYVAALLDGNAGAPPELYGLDRCLTVRKRESHPAGVLPNPAGRDGGILGAAETCGKQYLGSRP